MPDEPNHGDPAENIDAAPPSENPPQTESPPRDPPAGNPPPVDPPPPPGSSTGGQQSRKNLIFWKDMNEVYLLLDFVSGRPDRRLDTLTMPNPTPDGGPPWTSSQIVRKITEIPYPPEGPPEVDAAQAAVLLMAKDALSRLANPARGQTIAYTAMYVEAEARPGSISHFARWIVTKFRRRPAAHDAVSMGKDQGSLSNLARLTFPHFAEHVRRFRFFRSLLVAFGVVVLVGTVQTSWDIAHGRAVLQRLDQVAKDRLTIVQANPELLKPNLCPTYSPGQLQPDPTTPNGWTNDAKTAIPCTQLWYLAEHEAEARLDLDRIFNCTGARCNGYLHVLHWGLVLCSGTNLLEPEPKIAEPSSASKVPPGTTPGASETAGQETAPIGWQSATSVLMVFTTYVLPMFFGLLGTIIGAFRNIQQKVRDSELAPRDYGMTMLGLPLGAVAGIVVGLFFAPPTSPIQGAGGVAADLTLTASGLGFLAGYGSQSFFEFLDQLLDKVFPADSASRPPPASAGH